MNKKSNYPNNNTLRFFFFFLSILKLAHSMQKWVYFSVIMPIFMNIKLQQKIFVYNFYSYYDFLLLIGTID